MDEVIDIEKYQYDEYMKKHRGTPGCGGILLVISLTLLVLIL